MKFGAVPIEESVGAILAHSVRLADGSRLRKGIGLGSAEVDRLAASAIAEVVVARLEPDDVSEDFAARALAEALAGPGTEVSTAHTGRCNVVAVVHGLAELDTAALAHFNGVDEAITAATLRPAAPVHPGDLVATVKIIPYGVPAALVERLRSDFDAAAVSVRPFSRASVTLVRSWGPDGPVDVDLMEAALDRRLRALGSTLEDVLHCAHDISEVAASTGDALANGADLVLIAGASAVSDRRDVVPAAVDRIGGEVLRFGLPVDPGNLAVLARKGATPILGVPGCASSPRRNGFDWVLERVLAGYALDGLQVPEMGVGGLLKEPRGRPHPRREGGATPQAKVGAVILAAGVSARMGDENKLLVRVGGVPMVRRAANIASRSGLDPIVVVVGHEQERVREALDGIECRFVVNERHADGMSTSVVQGVRSIRDEVDGAVVLLGDMPWLRTRDVRALVDAFDPDGGAGICVPIRGRRRGNPVLWASRYFDRLETLEGDVGARHLLSEYDDDLREVTVDDDGVLRDVDTPDQLDAPTDGD